MLSWTTIRILAALLVLALFATVASGAQCVVRCVSPVTPPPCHHHSPGKQSAPAQACAAEMLPGEARWEVAPAAIVGAALGVPVARSAVAFLSDALPMDRTDGVGAHFILRI